MTAAMRSSPIPVSTDGLGRGVSLPDGVAVELHEDEVPDFDKPLAGVVREGARAGFGAEVVMDFRVGAAGAGFAHLPEVVVLIQAEDAVLGDACDLLPELFGLVVFAKNGDVERSLGRP